MSQFEYVVVLISIIVGLALTQILRGVGRMVTAEGGPASYWVHLLWTFYLFMNITLFWWWEFRLGTIDWSLAIYLVVTIYAVLFFFISLVVQPGDISGMADYKQYYYSRRRWIFGLLIALTLWDFVDTSIKGSGHFATLGAPYIAFNSLLISASAIAMVTANERYHKIFAVGWSVIFLGFQFITVFVID